MELCIRASLRLWRCRRGSASLEGVLLFPAILLCLAAAIVFGLLMYYKMGLYQQAVLTTDRTAAHWGYADSDPETGTHAVGGEPSLYWRLLQDQASGWLGWAGLGSDAILALPSGDHKQTSSPLSKLQQGASLLPESFSGTFRYANRLFVRKVELDVQGERGNATLLTERFSRPTLHARASAWISDPVEGIRMTDLARTFVGSLQDKLWSDSVQEEIKTMEPAPASIISSEKEASAYIRKLVGGKEVIFKTEQVGQSRKVDALDRDGIAHEAKYTVNSTDAKQQILKDVELVRRGEVKGVVWHFFRNQKTGKTGLTASLKKELEKNGIVIVIHN